MKYQFGTSSNGPWHDTMQGNDKYRRDSLDGGTTWGSAYQFRGTDGSDGDPAAYLRSIQVTEITQGSVKSAKIEGALIRGAEIYGGVFGDLTNDNNPNVWIQMGEHRGGYGMKLWSKSYGGYPIFSVWDNDQGNTVVSMKTDPILFHAPNGEVQPRGTWNFSGATVTGIHYTLA